MPAAKSKLPSWINEPPAEEEIMRNADGSEFIPIPLVERKLTKLDPLWSTQNFRFKMLVGVSGNALIDGSLELLLTYGGRKRSLVGAATILIPENVDITDPANNTNYGAWLKSECTKNAVKPIGLAFGQGLNDRLYFEPSAPKTPRVGLKKPPAEKMIPDKVAQHAFNKAYEANSERTMKAYRDIYPDIQYTGDKNASSYAES